jgi:glycosyltransferase involved in cell wall biosynthesis
MKALVTLSARFDRGPDGMVYPQNPALTYGSLFKRYLDVFEEILVVARVETTESPIGAYPSDGAGVTFIDVPAFSGVMDLIKFLPQIRTTLRQAISDSDAYFLRVPDILGTLAYKEIRRLGLPFAVEVVGDPADSLQAGSVRHFLRPLIRLIAIRSLRSICTEATAATYVTKGALQRQYPPGIATYSTYFSDVELPQSFFLTEARIFTQSALHLVFVGTLNEFYKAPDILVEALAVLAAQGLSLHLTFVGDGRRRAELSALIKARGIERQVTFLGKVPSGAGVATALDAADLFILPSRQEGLPKAMIEAMARGLPCIGSTVGGMPELLPPEDLVPPGEARALAEKIREIVRDPARLTRMSSRNLAVAQEYRNEVLQVRRLQFYRQVRELAEKAKEGQD